MPRLFLSALFTLLLAFPVLAAPPKLWGTVEFRRPVDTLSVWNSMLSRYRSIFENGRKFRKNLTWNDLEKSVKGGDKLSTLRKVNAFWNEWPYREDIVNWGVADYWAAPNQFLEKSGDCEDYAIAKYYTLKNLGFSPEEMRIVIVRDTVRGFGHAILAVYLGDRVYILDNLSKNVLEAGKIHNYAPEYSLNELSRWAHIKGKKVAQ